jgi:flagellar biosynthesis protein FliQ
MDWQVATTLAQHAVLVALWVGMPLVLAATGAGLVLGFLQGALGHSDSTVLVGPRLLAAGLAFLMFGTWMLALLSRYWVALWLGVPNWLGR